MAYPVDCAQDQDCKWTIRASVNTLYKYKANKVHPINYSWPSVQTLRNTENW